MINTREIALDCIMEIMEKKKYSHYVIRQVLDKYGYLEKRDRSFIKCVTEGTVERAVELDYVIDSFSKIKVSKMKPLIRSLLRMSTYQLLYMDKTMDAAVCNEAVKLACKRGFSSLKGFINGVLRTIARNKTTITYPDKQDNLILYLSVVYSMPEWIVSMWLERFGREKTEDILKGLLAKRPLMIRMDEGMNTEERKALYDRFVKSGFVLEPLKDYNELAYAYLIKNPDRAEQLPGFSEGQIMIQDAGSMLITEFAKIEKNWHIIDVCGAPGGKALHAASKLAGSGFISVRDISEAKVALIRENIERSSYRNIEAKIWDATVLDEDEIGRADLLIADLPCSGLGVIGRKPDIKYRVSRQGITDAAKLQRDILSVVCRYVKPGGRLLYSTCTLTKEENEQNAAWFSESFDFDLQKEQTLFPSECGYTDGFYMACFVRRGNEASSLGSCCRKSM